MAPLIWFGVACRSRLSLAPLRLVQHNLRQGSIVVKSAYSTQQTAIESSQLQFVAMDHNQNRQLYTRNTLGLEKLKLHQEFVSQFYRSNKDEYIERLHRYVALGDSQNIVIEDLINLIGLASSKKELDLIEDMVGVLASKREFFISGWGTALMRLYFIMNEIDRANKNLRDTGPLGQLFNRKSCYRICMTMLFSAGKYQDVIDVYHQACEKLEPTESNKSPQHPGISVIAFGAYAKMNTPESLRNAMKLFNEVDINHFSSYLNMRVISFIIHLHITQGKPIDALNLISNSPFQSYVTMRELKTIALINTKRYEDVNCHILNSLNGLERGSKLILKDVYEILQSNLDTITNEQVRNDLKDTLNELKHNGLVAEVTLESLLYSGINNQKVGEQLNHHPTSTANQLAKRQQRLRLKALKAKTS